MVAIATCQLEHVKIPQDSFLDAAIPEIWCRAHRKLSTPWSRNEIVISGSLVSTSED